MTATANTTSGLDLQQAARDHLWMHFTRMSAYRDAPVPIIERGEGCYLYDTNGKRYLDALAGLDLATVPVTLAVTPDGDANAGTGAAVLGHPAAPIAWLARALHQYDAGAAIEAGAVVIPGAVSRALPVAAGQTARATFAGLGEVAATFEARQLQ